MNLLLTGANGFVGKNLKSYLTGLCNTEELTRADLNDLKFSSIKNSTNVVHLAGLAHDLKNTNQVEAYYHVNFELTKKLYDAFLTSNASKFIFISSVKAAADTVESVLSEDVFPDPLTHYGKSKLKAEQYIQSQPLPVGKSYYILRPCMIHGPSNKGNLNLLYQLVRKGLPYPLASFENKRSFLSIENLCYVIKELMVQTDVPSGIYHISDDEPLSTNDVVKIFSMSLKRKPVLWHINKSFIYFIAKIGDQLKLSLNSEKLNKLTENYIVSNEKIKGALNIKLPIEAKEGLMITAASFK